MIKQEGTVYGEHISKMESKHIYLDSFHPLVTINTDL